MRNRIVTWPTVHREPLFRHFLHLPPPRHPASSVGAEHELQVFASGFAESRRAPANPPASRPGLGMSRRHVRLKPEHDQQKHSESGKYYAPAEGSLEELKEYTRGLPVEDSPETFGLHPNADITFQQVNAPTPAFFVLLSLTPTRSSIL